MYENMISHVLQRKTIIAEVSGHISKHVNIINVFHDVKNSDYVHTLRIGFVPKYFCFVMTCPHNLWNVPELIVHM